MNGLKAPGRNAWTNFSRDLQDLASSIEDSAILVNAYGEFVSRKISQQMQMSSSSVRLADRYDGGSMAAPSKPAPVVIVKKKTEKKQKKTNKGVDEKKMTVVNKEGNLGNVEVKTPRGRVSFGKMEVVQVLSPESDESMGGEPSPAQTTTKKTTPAWILKQSSRAPIARALPAQLEWKATFPLSLRRRNKMLPSFISTSSNSAHNELYSSLFMLLLFPIYLYNQQMPFGNAMP